MPRHRPEWAACWNEGAGRLVVAAVVFLQRLLDVKVQVALQIGDKQVGVDMVVVKHVEVAAAPVIEMDVQLSYLNLSQNIYTSSIGVGNTVEFKFFSRCG